MWSTQAPSLPPPPAVVAGAAAATGPPPTKSWSAGSGGRAWLLRASERVEEEAYASVKDGCLLVSCMEWQTKERERERLSLLSSPLTLCVSCRYHSFPPLTGARAQRWNISLPRLPFSPFPLYSQKEMNARRLLFLPPPTHCFVAVRTSAEHPSWKNRFAVTSSIQAETLVTSANAFQMEATPLSSWIEYSTVLGWHSETQVFYPIGERNFKSERLCACLICDMRIKCLGWKQSPCHTSRIIFWNTIFWNIILLYSRIILNAVT